jgi:predicted metal-dependent phosphoesterase TrpH
MLRVDLHHHINTDPVDGRFVSHSAGELIDHAAAAGLNVLAITCHESIPYDDDVFRYARERGVVLLRGMEATVDGYHVLLLNFRDFPPGVCTLAEVVDRKTPEALVIAPHPFYPAGIAGGPILAAHRAVFDAVEFSGMYTALTRRFNQHAQAHARGAGLAVIGNTDTHFLWQLGRTFTLVDAAAEPGAVVEAIRHQRVQLVTQPLSWVQLMRFLVATGATLPTLRDGLRYMLRVLQRTRAGARPAVEQGCHDAVRPLAPS